MQKTLSNVRPFSRHLLVGMIALSVLSLSLSPIPLMAQELIVTGHITSSDDSQSFPGASIIIKGTNVGVTSDADGNYTIRVLSSESILVISAIGYATTEILVGNQTAINVDLKPDITSLNEVVVVGYGTVKKSDVTGALVSVNEKTLRERPMPNVLQAIQGKAAGVNVTSNFKPGEVPAITIRGQRSIQATNAPLYVVDGIPLNPASNSGTNGDDNNSDSPSALADINPNDIASVEILKDASATAIYGSRGANGVVLITTKRGTKGAISISYNATVSLDSYKSLTTWMNGGQYADQYRLGLINGGQYVLPSTKKAITYADPTADVSGMALSLDAVAQKNEQAGYEWVDGVVGGTVVTRPTTPEEQAAHPDWPAEIPVWNPSNVKTYDWRNAVIQQGITNNHQIAISSGTETSRLYISLTAFDQKGVQRDQNYKRYNALINGDITANKWLSLGMSANLAYGNQNYGVNGPSSNTGPKDLYGRAVTQWPYAQPYTDAGIPILNAGGDKNNFNPIIDITQSLNQRQSASVIASSFAEIKFTPWLKFRTNLGGQYRDYRTGTWGGPSATATPNRASYAYDQKISYTNENLLYIDKTFLNVHTIGVTLLESTQTNRQEGTSTSVTNTTQPSALWYNLAANTLSVPPSYSSNYSMTALMSYMLRVNYTFKNKYMFTATGRSDGASVLAPGHKWDYFPSGAIAWKMQEENFMKNISWIDELKPRISYGVVGNSSVGAYTSSGPLSINPYAYGATAAIGYLPQTPPNPNLHWERSATWNGGVDFSLLRGRVSGALEVYQTITSDLLIDKAIPAPEGFVNKTQNIGKTQNRGLEITLSGTVLDKQGFSWNIDANWSEYRNKILELINGKQDMLAQRLFIGQPVNVYYNWANAGIWSNSDADLAEIAKFNANGTKFAPGTVKVVDQNGDYKIDASDYVIRGTSNPKWTGGITNTFKYKNWTLSTFLYARVGQTYFGIYPNYGFKNPNGRVETDFWSPTNPNGRWPQPNTSSSITNYPTAMQYGDGTFYTIRNISLSYVFPREWLTKVFMKDLTLNVQVINPFIFGGDAVKHGINPDDTSNWSTNQSSNVSTPNSATAQPVGGINNNTILPQSLVFGIRANF